jgi:hypothetical protein
MPFPKIDNAMLNIGNGVGQLLQLNSAGKLPALDASQLTNLVTGNQSGSALVLLNTQVVPAGGVGQIDFTTGIDGTYKEYVVRASDVSISSANDLYLRVRSGGVFKSTMYTWGGQVLIINGATSPSGIGGSSSDYFLVVPGNANLSGANADLGFTFNITNPAGTNRLKAMHVIGGGNGVDTNSAFTYYFGGAWANNSDYSAIDGLRFFPISGLINSGTFKLYGVL